MLRNILFALCAMAALSTVAEAAPPQAESGGASSAAPALSPYPDMPLAELERRVAAGDIDAHVELASRYGTGKGVKVDYEKAVALSRVAAEHGNAVAQYYLGTAYYNGGGVPKDLAVAFLWLEKSAAQNYPLANYWAGYMIANGLGGISPTWAGALPYLWKAATLGNFEGAFLLGVAYDQENTDVDRNPRAAAYWYRQAIYLCFKEHKLLDPKSQYNLLILIKRGEVPWQEGDPPAWKSLSHAAVPAKAAVQSE